MREGKWRNSNQKLVLIIFLLFTVCFLPGCDAYNKITGSLSKYGYQVSVAENPDGTGGMNVNITPKENQKFLPDGNVTLQCSIPTYLGAKIPAKSRK